MRVAESTLAKKAESRVARVARVTRVAESSCVAVFP